MIIIVSFGSRGFGSIFTLVGNPEEHRGVSGTPTSNGLVLVDDGSQERSVVERDEWQSWLDHDFSAEDESGDPARERYWDEWAPLGRGVEYSDSYEVYRVED